MVSQEETREFFRTFKVLFVEDDKEVREVFASFLQRRFKEVYIAADGQEGLERYKEYRPDLVITDVMMPELNGLAMSAMIKEINPNTPIIVVTAHDDINLLAEAVGIGIDGYVMKPIDDRILVQTIKKALFGLSYQKAKRDLQEKDTLISVVLDNSPAGICLFGDSGIIYANKALEGITGYAREELLGGSLLNLMQCDSRMLSERIDFVQESACNLERYSEIRIKTKRGKVRYVDLIFNSVEFHENYISIANMIDVTDKRWFKEELEHSRAKLEELNRELKYNLQVIQQKNRLLEEQLYTDKLTSLPNRYRLLEDLKHAMSPLLILLNIDSFKEVNDFYGTEVGDFVLKEIGKRLQSLTHEGRFQLYKLQADEYALLDTRCSREEDLDQLGQRVHDDVDSHLIYLKEQEIHIRFSAGIAHGEGASVMTRADIALKLAKSHNKPFLVYDDTMEVMKEYEENFRWIRMLKSALDDNRVVGYFQPVFDNHTKEVYKYECLARLIGEDGKVYPPFFIAIAKKARLYHRITQAIVSDACRVFQHTTHNFSINLSIDDILNPQTIDFIINELERYGVAHRVVFEILETEGIDNYEVVNAFIQRMKKYGCQIAIDDFGSGYSNFAHILRLNVDIVKIDASIIKNSDTDKNSQIIAKTIVEFAHKLGIKTVAEFVHSKTVLDMVKSFGVDYSQGYFIGEPSRMLLASAKPQLAEGGEESGGGGGDLLAKARKRP